MNRRLYRSPNDRVMAGVAGGMAETYDFDPAMARVVWTLLILFTGGVFLILYIVMALVVPLRPSDEPFSYDETRGWAAGPPPGHAAPLGSAPAGSTFEGDSTTTATAGTEVPPPHFAAARPPRPRPDNTNNNAPVVIGAILILVGALFLLRQFIAIDLGRLWPIAVIVIGLLLVISALGRGRRNP